MPFPQNMKRFAVLAFCTLLLFGLTFPIANLQAEAEDYKVIVKTTFEGNPVEGVDINLTGGTINKTETSGLNDTVFTDLTAGKYAITITFSEEADFELSANSSGQQSVDLTATTRTGTVVFFLRKKDPPVDENLQSIQGIKLPANLTKVGSTTTDFSKLTTNNIGAVENFTFDNPGVNKITYLSKLNLSNYEDFSKITLINDYLDLEQVGKVRFDTALLKVFDKSARITMGKVRLISLKQDKTVAKIMRDGASFDLENASYANNSLSFDVDGFSTYTIAPRFEVDFSSLIKSTTAEDEYQNETDTLKLSLLVDNLDAQVTVLNNGEIINVDGEPANDGTITGDVKLAAGSNRIKVEVKLANGEKVEKFFTVKYQPSAGPANDVSKVFGFAFFCLIILAGLGVGVYYLKMKKQQPKVINRTPLTRQKPSYNQNLLTEEEKKLYDDEPETTTATEPIATETSKKVEEQGPVEKAREAALEGATNPGTSPIVIDKGPSN